MDPFQHWLESGLDQRDPEREFEGEQLIEFFTRFNRDIGTIRNAWSDAQLAEGIWYLYGCGSCYLGELSKLEPNIKTAQFFDSVIVLYKDLFEARCTTFFSHLDRGPEPPNPLNGACYMLWDMDCGLDSFSYSGRPEYIQLSIDLLGRLSASTHPAVIESVIHGLGHMMLDHRKQCQPILECIAAANLPPELKEYADNALNSCIQ